MAYENKPNSGALFKNEKTKATQPDYTGNWTDATGKEWRLAAWLKDGKAGEFLSVSASEKMVGSRPRRDPPNDPNNPDDRIPF